MRVYLYLLLSGLTCNWLYAFTYAYNLALGHYQKAPSEEIMITQEDIFGVNIGEPWAPGEVEEEVLKGNEKGFITSPADIDPQEPIKLREAEVTPEHRKAF